MTYADADKELVEVDSAIAVGVEERHDCSGIVPGDLELDLAEARVELLGIDLVVAIERVEVSEGSAEAADGLSPTGLDLRPDALEDCTGSNAFRLGYMLKQVTWAVTVEL